MSDAGYITGVAVTAGMAQEMTMAFEFGDFIAKASRKEASWEGTRADMIAAIEADVGLWNSGKGSEAKRVKKIADGCYVLLFRKAKEEAAQAKVTVGNGETLAGEAVKVLDAVRSGALDEKIKVAHDAVMAQLEKAQKGRKSIDSWLLQHASADELVEYRGKKTFAAKKAWLAAHAMKKSVALPG